MANIPPRRLLPNPDLPGTLLVPLTKGYVAIIDEADGPAVAGRCWTASTSRHKRTVYAVGSRKRGEAAGSRSLLLHRFLWDQWGLVGADEVDHKNRNALDCRRENLRAATSLQNKANTGKRATNTTGYKGVSRTGGGRFRARITVGRSERLLGIFDTAEAAARAHQAAAVEMRGEFAVEPAAPRAAAT